MIESTTVENTLNAAEVVRKDRDIAAMTAIGTCFFAIRQILSKLFGLNP
jgi:hypothetical protein